MEPTDKAPPARPVVVLGEVLCDLFPHPASGPLTLETTLRPLPGGAPSNVAIQLSRLGAPVALITAVGDDPLGGLVLDALRAEGVEVAWVKRDPSHRTGITLVTLDAHGERTFYPWRADTADQNLAAEDVDEALVRGASVLHHGTVSLRAHASAEATRRAVAVARAAGVPVSVDVNLRPKMFPSAEVLAAAAREAVRGADVVKATLEEGRVVTGEQDLEAVRAALHHMGPRLVLLTLDVEGAVLSLRGDAGDDVVRRVEALSVETVDATGAGDAFMGATLYALRGLLLRGGDLASLSAGDLEKVGRAGCEAGARAVTALGACTAMPTALEALRDDAPTR